MPDNDQPQSRKGEEIQRLCDRAREAGSLGGLVLEAWLLEAYGLGLKDAASSETADTVAVPRDILANAVRALSLVDSFKAHGIALGLQGILDARSERGG